MENLAVDWQQLPRPVDDGATDHLEGATLPSGSLPSTAGGSVDLSVLAGVVVIYAYPMTGGADGSVPQGWNDIPGARGCTPQSCAYRDLFAELREAGADEVYGLSTQSTEEQAEAASRLRLPYPLLSDPACGWSSKLKLPTMVVDGRAMLRRLTMIARDGVIVKTRYPVFPPDQDAPEVAAWLRANA